MYILGTFCVKESSILIGLDNFRTRVFSIKSNLGWSSLHQLKNKEKSLPIRVPSTNIYIIPQRPYPTVMLLEIEH